MNIQRVRNISKEAFLQDYLIPNKPVIVVDAMSNWQIDKFSPQFLSSTAGNHEVQVYNELFDLQTIDTLKNYFTQFFNQKNGLCTPYVRAYSKLKDVDFFWADHMFEAFKEFWSAPYFFPTSSFAIPLVRDTETINVNNALFPYRGLFVSARGARTRLHRDPFNSDAVLCQFYGRKRMKLYDPGQAKYLMSGQEFVDIEKPDLKKFDNFQSAVCTYQDILSPGEIVYFPSGWFHDVSCVTDSISITWNFVHSAKVAAFCSFINEHSDDKQLETVRFFLKDFVKQDASTKEITEFLEKEFVTA